MQMCSSISLESLETQVSKSDVQVFLKEFKMFK